MKRAIDLVFAGCGLLLVSPLWLLIAVLIYLEDRRPILSSEERIGRGFKPFLMFRFRTVLARAPRNPGDPAMTRLGRFLSKWGLDELPQLLNVLRGEMSLVGPHPERRRGVEAYRKAFEEL